MRTGNVNLFQQRLKLCVRCSLNRPRADFPSYSERRRKSNLTDWRNKHGHLTKTASYGWKLTECVLNSSDTSLAHSVFILLWPVIKTQIDRKWAEIQTDLQKLIRLLTDSSSSQPSASAEQTGHSSACQMKAFHTCWAPLEHKEDREFKPGVISKVRGHLTLSSVPDRMSFVASFLTEGKNCLSENIWWPSSQRYLNTTWTYRKPKS